MSWDEFEWAQLATALAGVLSSLTSEQCVVLRTRAGNRFVQFASQGCAGLVAEAASNRVLLANERLDATALDRMDALGWNRPTHDLGEGDEGSGSPNHFFEYVAPAPWARVASQAVRTLVDVFRVQHPNELRYYAFGDGGIPILLPTLGLERDDDAAPENPLRDHDLAFGALVDRVAEVLDGTFDDVTPWNDDGFLHVETAGATISVRVHGEPPVVSVFAPLVSGVDAGDARVLLELGQQNLGARFVRFVVNDDVVIAEHDQFGRPFVPEHLVYAVGLVAELAASIDDDFAERFGGFVFFDGDERHLHGPRDDGAP